MSRTQLASNSTGTARWAILIETTSRCPCVTRIRTPCMPISGPRSTTTRWPGTKEGHGRSGKLDFKTFSRLNFLFGHGNRKTSISTNLNNVGRLQYRKPVLRIEPVEHILGSSGISTCCSDQTSRADRRTSVERVQNPCPRANYEHGVQNFDWVGTDYHGSAVSADFGSAEKLGFKLVIGVRRQATPVLADVGSATLSPNSGI
jgi:hypothetical protein